MRDLDQLVARGLGTDVGLVDVECQQRAYCYQLGTGAGCDGHKQKQEHQPSTAFPKESNGSSGCAESSPVLRRTQRLRIGGKDRDIGKCGASETHCSGEAEWNAIPSNAASYVRFDRGLWA